MATAAGAVALPEQTGGPLDGAHLRDKKMGGDHGQWSSEAKHIISLCRTCHQLVHAHRLVMTYGPDMGDGAVAFTALAPVHEIVNCYKIISR